MYAAAEVAQVQLADVERSQENTELVIHYYRRDGQYDGWGLHVWGDVAEPTGWDSALVPTGSDDYGVFWSLLLPSNAASAGFLVHRGDDKDCTGTVTAGDAGALWLVAGNGTLFLEEPDVANLPQGNLSKARAFWVTATTLAWDLSGSENKYTLHASQAAALKLTGEGVEGADVSLPLEVSADGLPDEVTRKFPHIKGYTALKLPTDVNAAELLMGQLALAAVDGGGAPLDATQVQTAGVLDDLFAYDGPLGAECPEGGGVALRLWAPTAQSVTLLLYSSPRGGDAERVPMTEAGGVWTAEGPASWKGRFYLYEVAVYHWSTGKVETCQGVDPYSRGLAANGTRSLLIDLAAPELSPKGWERLHSEKRALERFNDVAIYELHIRDFSASDPTVDDSIRGGYLAFTAKGSLGMKHLESLAAAGMTHIHLLPCFDFSTVNELKETWKSYDEEHLKSLPPDSEEQQAAVMAVADEDGFNWGYDPVNWGTPDGSYSSDPDGPIRTLEFRSMVQGINRAGLRVVLDVVYNHTHGSGPGDMGSVLDKVVPGYYLRRSADGSIENSTCMNNTASEHYMMDRIIVDDLLMWAKEYKVDGFRFDLMGHLMKSTMEKARDSLRALTVEKDGVDGSSLYIYGEGWDFGEIANNQRGVNASQLNLYGTGIGSFNDRIRDTAMGGSPFGDPQQQGFLTGLLLQPNELDQGSEEQQGRALAAQSDWIRVGLTGNLRDFRFHSAEGVEVSGAEVRTHDGVPVGYAASPSEVVNYVSAHDNETLFDVIMLKTAKEVNLAEKCRINHMATSLVALSQGVAFFHAGDDMLRSKSLDRDSYNSGDWFNRLDFTYESNNFGVGLPPQGKNGEKWKIMRELLANPELKPGKGEIAAALANLRELLAVRFSTPLLRLSSATDVQERLRFLHTGPEATPGVIVMSLQDGGGGDSGLAQLDSKFRSLLVVFNARPSDASVALPSLGGVPLVLHPVQAEGYDERVKASTYDSESAIVAVPARTTAVFVEHR